MYGWKVPEENIAESMRDITMELPQNDIWFDNHEYNIKVLKIASHSKLKKREIPINVKDRKDCGKPIDDPFWGHSKINTYRLIGRILNNVVSHPTLPIIASSGIEKCVRINMTYPIDEEYLIEGGSDPQTTEDVHTHLFFRTLLRSERQLLQEHLWREYNALPSESESASDLESD